jgi:hypothetical protein
MSNEEMLPKLVKELDVVDPISKPNKVNGVRVYTHTPEVLAAGEQVYYSRRGVGPYYRWLLETPAGRWRAARVIDAAFTHHSLSLTTWKTVPEALMTRLGEHYLE